MECRQQKLGLPDQGHRAISCDKILSNGPDHDDGTQIPFVSGLLRYPLFYGLVTVKNILLVEIHEWLRDGLSIIHNILD